MHRYSSTILCPRPFVWVLFPGATSAASAANGFCREIYETDAPRTSRTKLRER